MMLKSNRDLYKGAPFDASGVWIYSHMVEKIARIERSKDTSYKTLAQ